VRTCMMALLVSRLLRLPRQSRRWGHLNQWDKVVLPANDDLLSTTTTTSTTTPGLRLYYVAPSHLQVVCSTKSSHGRALAPPFPQPGDGGGGGEDGADAMAIATEEVRLR
jgi:hypothetical protein